ncbi:MAG: GTPase Era [Alphaproteobacteria bacterium]|nr:GTPase Era [Alphaproteobacteria bacterium]
MTETKCGIVAIIGEPNAGKSTLINRLVGGKVSIVTPKVQTTRFNIRGVCVHEQSQIIFVDTPGIFSAEKNFEKAMVSAAWSGIGDADAVLMLIDSEVGIRASTRELLDKLKTVKKPVFLALNKVDAVEKNKLFALAQTCADSGAFQEIFMISAKSGDGVDAVMKELSAVVPAGPFLYPEDQMSDISLRLLAAEITREKIFMKLEQELPYAIFVETESWEETETSVKVAQVILVQREGQKKIVIGDGGQMIKNIGIAARKDLEKVVDKRIHLSLFVKVKPNWKDDSESYRLLGLEFKR